MDTSTPATKHVEIEMKMTPRFFGHGPEKHPEQRKRNSRERAGFIGHGFCPAVLVFFVVSMLFGCAADIPYHGEQEAQDFLQEHTGDAVNAHAFEPEKRKEEPLVLPERFQQPTFLLQEADAIEESDFTIPVGADISSNVGPVTLREIMKKLALLKGMNVSWASDVDQGALVDVDIRAEDDFFEAIDNLLRQLDYYHEVKGNSIIVRHKETRQFHIAMPFMAPEFNSGVGGDVLGGGDEASHEMKGTIQITSAGESEDSFDIWSNIRANLDQILDIWTTEEVVSSSSEGGQPAITGPAGAAPPPTVVTNRKPGKGYYTIDKPIGLITVTAPRSLLSKVESYIDNLKKELYRQVSIEAKIVEVTLESDNTTGLNWEDLLQNTNNPFSFNLDFQKVNPFYHSMGTQNKFFTVNSKNFTLILDAMQQQGHVEVISNPKISVMNGQPAMISVGESLTYIDSVEANVEDGVITYSVATSNVMSGLGLAVIATILDTDEVVLTLTPVTSQVETPIEYRQFGNLGSEVGLPKVAIREMTTLVRVRNGEMLIVGGLIDGVQDYAESNVPGMRDLPGGKKIFGQSGTNKYRKELVILLRPVII